MVESEESDYGEDMLDMIENDDIEFLKDAVDKKSYGILKNVIHIKKGPVSKKRRLEDIDTLENQYENQLEAPEIVKNLLPIKTKDGIIARSLRDKNISVNEKLVNYTSTINEEENSEDEYILEADCNSSVPKSSADLLARYNESLRNKKVHIGYLCSSLLENPEEKVSNFRVLFKLLEEDVLGAPLSVKKLIIVSLLEVFKDLLPSYQIKHQDSGNVKLKKDTLKLQKYEETLLQYYKKYLQKLEKFSNVVRKQLGNVPLEEFKLGELAVHAMADLLVSHPYFNYSQNIAQAIIPFLNHRESSVRLIIVEACKTIFKEDKKEEITLKILRLLNHYLKNRAHNIRSEMIEILLFLKIKEVNLDQEKENQMKQKKVMSHKQNILKLSKKERKRKRKLQEVEKEMLETKAEENKQIKQKNLTEITKIMFGIFFRILKSSNNTKVLGICLEGLAKFSHCINLDYYIDLLNLLSGLLNEDRLGYREQIHCIQTVFAIVHGQGDAINLDPTRFYICLYSNLLETHASKTYGNCAAILKALYDVLVKRGKKITSKRTIGFVKRISTLSLQLLHNGSLGMLALMKQILILNKSTDILLDLDSSIGNGDYQAELNDPEYCNASSTALYELALLKNHYHPVVAKYSRHIANGTPSTGEGSLPLQFSKSTPEELFVDFDASEMAFNPPVKVPKKIPFKIRRRRKQFNTDFKQRCDLILKRSKYSMFS